MTDTPRYRTLRDYLGVVRAHRLLIVVVALVFGVGSYLLWSSQNKTYTVSASISCKDPIVDDNLTGGSAIARQSPEVESAICADIVTSPEVVRRVGKRLRIPASRDDALRSRVTAKTETTSNLVVITADAASRSAAALFANQFARETERYRTKQERARFDEAARSLARRFKSDSKSSSTTLSRALIDERVARAQSVGDLAQPVSLVEPALRSKAAVSPNVELNTTLGLLVGLTLGVVAAFLRDALDVRLRGVGEIQAELGLPLLAAIGRDGLGTAGPLAGGRKKLSEGDREALRIMRRNLDFMAGEKNRSIAVTSAVEGEGKSTVAVSLAWAYAATGRRTLLIDADLRRGQIAQRLGIPPAPGLADYLAQGVDSRDIFRPIPLGDSVIASLSDGNDGDNGTAAPPLVCIPAGSPPDAPAEMLESEAFKDFLAVASRSFDRVVLDTGPLLPVADTLEILSFVDSAVVCVRASQTKRAEARAAIAALDNFPDVAAGLVVTAASEDEYPNYGYYRTPAENDGARREVYRSLTARTPGR